MRTTLALALLLLAPGLCGAQDKMAEALRKGIVEEDSNQNLNAAIQSYQAVLTQYDEDRKSAATALFRLGECYRKQGNNDQATAAYRRVVQEFADQTKLAEQSRSHLPKAQQRAGAPDPAVAEARHQLRAILLEKMRDAEDELGKAQIADERVPVLRKSVTDLRSEMAALDIRRQEAAVKGSSTDEAVVWAERREALRSQLERAQDNLASEQAAGNRIAAIKEQLLDLRQQLAAFDLETAQQGAAMAVSPKR